MIKCNYAIKLDKDVESIYVAKDGETIKIETVNAYGEHFSNLSEFMSLISHKQPEKHHHPLTGGIDVEGAKVGDVIRVDIKGIDIRIMGQALSQSAGVNPIEVNHFSDRAPIIAMREPNSNIIKYMNGYKIPYRPMLGMIGTAPAMDCIKTGHAGVTGGNLDIPFITAGVSVYLPVKVDGGHLFFGDAHGNQGYGELGGIALEASAILEVKLSVLHPRQAIDNIVVIGKEPMSNKQAIGVVGVAYSFQDLNEAVKDAWWRIVDTFVPMFPTISENYVCNILTSLGNSMNGQAWSKTSESTSIITVFEEDLSMLLKDTNYNIQNSFESVWFNI